MTGSGGSAIDLVEEDSPPYVTAGVRQARCYRCFVRLAGVELWVMGLMWTGRQKVFKRCFQLDWLAFEGWIGIVAAISEP